MKDVMEVLGIDMKKYQNGPTTLQTIKEMRDEIVNGIKKLVRKKKIEISKKARKITLHDDIGFDIISLLPLANVGVPEKDSNPWVVYKDGKEYGKATLKGWNDARMKYEIEKLGKLSFGVDVGFELTTPISTKEFFGL